MWKSLPGAFMGPDSEADFGTAVEAELVVEVVWLEVKKSVQKKNSSKYVFHKFKFS